jgi:pantetheine-phosphate adenylyltransferase
MARDKRTNVTIKSAVYPGTFDPITNGHLDIIRRAAKLFDRLTVLVVNHPEKSPLFSLDKRIEFVSDAIRGCEGVRVDSFDGLLMDYVRDEGICVVVRGLRAVSDFDYEFQLTQLNRRLNPNMETIFIMPREEYFFLSSSMIKEIASYQGDISQFVPGRVTKALKRRYGEKG